MANNQGNTPQVQQNDVNENKGKDKDNGGKGTKNDKKAKGESSQELTRTPLPEEAKNKCMKTGESEKTEEKNKGKKETAGAEKTEEKNKGKKTEGAEKTEGKNKGKKTEGAEKTEEKKGEKTEDDEGNPNIIYPGKFDITWGNDEKYWKRPTDKESKDHAELIQVCWLQVTGSKQVKTGKSYEIKFKTSFTAKSSGWNGLPLFLMAKIGADGKSIWKKIKPLGQTTTGEKFDIPNTDEKFIVKIPTDDKGKEDQELSFGLYEIWSNKWKGGLLIHYATVQEARADDVAK